VLSNIAWFWRGEGGRWGNSQAASDGGEKKGFESTGKGQFLLPENRQGSRADLFWGGSIRDEKDAHLNKGGK